MTVFGAEATSLANAMLTFFQLGDRLQREQYGDIAPAGLLNHFPQKSG